MKRIRNAMILLGFSLMLLMPTLSLAAAETSATEAIGQVINMTGTVKAQKPDGTTRSLELDSPVFATETLTTASKSNLEVRLKDETILAQGPDSTISLDDYVYSTDPSASKLLFKMGKGTFRFITGEIVKQNPDAFNLKTPLTSIGIRGTEPFAVVSTTETIGLIDIDPAHTMEVTTSKGKVSMNKAGVSTNVGTDGSMSPPAPTAPEVKSKVMKVAPITSVGEIGTVGKAKDLDRKVKAFQQHMNHSKGKLGGIASKPSYNQLHTIQMQKKAHKTAEAQKAGTDPSVATTGGISSGGGSDSGGSGSGGCGH